MISKFILMIVLFHTVASSFTDVPRMLYFNCDFKLKFFGSFSTTKTTESFWFSRRIETIFTESQRKYFLFSKFVCFFFLKIHEYHSIVDRWRLRRHIHDYLPASDDGLFQFFDINHDHVISPVEFTRRLEIRPQQHQSENNQ